MPTIFHDRIENDKFDLPLGRFSVAIEADRDAAAAEPFYFGPEARPLFGWYHPAKKSAERKSTCVVLCSPMGYEGLCAHAFYRYLAETLSDSGYPVLRFDYDGTGDSFGSDDDEDRVASWIESVDHAIDTLRARSGVNNVALFGIRLGATLATIAASRRGDISHLALWAPCRSGKSYIREMRLLKAAHRGGNSAPSSASPESVDYEEAAGFFFTAETVADLMALDACSIEARPASRALVIGRDDLPIDVKLRNRFSSLGTETTTAEWSGFSDMMRDPQETQVPKQSVDSLLDWLERSAGSPNSPTTKMSAQDAEWKLRLEAFDYTEEPLEARRNEGMFGILTRPRRPVNAAPTILLLSVGANPHVGPNRMYVTLARRLAASGFSVLRLDVPGIGDSTRGCRPAREHIYSDAGVDGVEAIMRSLERDRSASGFVLVGLCSGAYIGFRAAAHDPRVVGQVLINPQTFEWNAGDSIEVRLSESYKLTRDYATALLDPKVILRLFTRKINVRGVLGALCKRLCQALRLTLRNLRAWSRHGRPYETQVCLDFRSISRRGSNTLFVFAEHDFGIEATAAHLGPKARKITRSGMVRYEIISGADHTFTQKAARDKLLRLLCEHIAGVRMRSPIYS